MPITFNSLGMREFSLLWNLYCMLLLWFCVHISVSKSNMSSFFVKGNHIRIASSNTLGHNVFSFPSLSQYSFFPIKYGRIYSQIQWSASVCFHKFVGNKGGAFLSPHSFPFPLYRTVQCGWLITIIKLNLRVCSPLSWTTSLTTFIFHVTFSSHKSTYFSTLYLILYENIVSLSRY